MDSVSFNAKAALQDSNDGDDNVNMRVVYGSSSDQDSNSGFKEESVANFDDNEDSDGKTDGGSSGKKNRKKKKSQMKTSQKKKIIYNNRKNYQARSPTTSFALYNSSDKFNITCNNVFLTFLHIFILTIITLSSKI